MSARRPKESGPSLLPSIYARPAGNGPAGGLVNYALRRAQRVIALRWLERPTAAEFNDVGGQLESWIRAEPHALGLIVVLSPRLMVPDAEQRQILEKRLGVLFPQLSWMGMVLEGNGLTAESKRLFVRAVALLTRARFTVFPSVDEALAALPASVGSAEEVRRELAAQSWT
jgi:hypothetical protein